MTTKDQQEFKKLIKEGTVEALRSIDGQSAIVDALRSSEGQNAIVNAMRSHGGQSAITDAMRSTGGQEAMVDAMNSKNGQDAIKKGSLAALKSEEGKDILIDNFVQGFHEVVVPSLDDHGVRIKRMERKMGVVAI